MQGEAIAVNLREMFGFRVPILSVVIGEGGSGGALAIGCANRNLIMEHSVYYVASPEACAAILWKARDKAATVSGLQTLCLATLTLICHVGVRQYISFPGLMHVANLIAPHVCRLSNESNPCL